MAVTSPAPRTPAPLSPDEIARIRAPFRGARLLPGKAYHDDDIFAWETEEIFFRDWLAVGRAEEVAEPGSFLVRDVLGESVLLVRGRDEVIRAFYNVCRHRGTAVEERECGKAVRFQCPYHAWIYELDGSLVRAKHTEDLDDFSLDTYGLAPIRCETWQGFVFLCFAPESVTAGLEAYMGDWYAHHAGFGRDMAPLTRAARLTYDVGANWKIVAENYSECYHCPPVHPLLNKLTPYDLGEDFLAEGPWKGGWMPFAEGCETMSMSGKRDGRPLLYARDETEARRIYYYILWPNLIVSVHPDYVLTHQAWPDGPNRSDRQLRPLRRGGPVGRDRRQRRGRVLGHHEPRGLPRRRGAAAGHPVTQLGRGPLLEPGGLGPRVRHHGRRPLRERRLAHHPRLAHRVGERPAARDRDPRSCSAGGGRRGERLRRPRPVPD